MLALDDAGCHPIKAREFAKIQRLAHDTFGLDLRSGKESLVSARLARHMRESGCRTFDQYYEQVVGDPTGAALIHLIDALTTNHTSFFREPAHFDFFRGTFLPQWRDRAGIDIWSAACSTGEEPYSIAMCALEQLGVAAAGKVRILATDISTRALATARQGIYPAERLEGLSAARLRDHWLRGEREWAGCYRAKKQLREMVGFRRQNLLEPVSHLGRFPLIFCRNVMIYFDKPTQQHVVECLSGCLEPGGYLLTGHAESLSGIRHGLHYVQPAVYRKASADGREKGPR